MRKNLPLVLALALTTASCAALGGDSGGAANLPNRGIAPWAALDDAGAFLLPAASGAALGEPGAIVEAGRVRLFVDRRDAGGVELIELDSDDGESFVECCVALAGARDPSPARADDGALWLAYVDDVTGAIGLAAESGGAFAVVTATAVEPGVDVVIGSPSLARHDGRWLLYYTRAEGGGPAVIARSSAGDDLAFAEDGVVLEPGAGCLASDGADTPCWDGAGVSAPDVRVATDHTGQTLFRLFYRGARASQGDLGFAASYDGLTFSRYPFNPVVDNTANLDGPTSVRLGDRYLLYWHEARSATSSGLGAGQNDEGRPAEAF